MVNLTREQVLEDTKNLYNLNNRSYNKDLGWCVYAPSENSPGCAVGRLLSKRLAKSLDKLDSNDPWPQSVNKIFNHLPDEVQILGLEFLEHIQHLHDRPDYWTVEGISDSGLVVYNGIKEQFCK